LNELVQSVTALPNLHPALVHFPIALLPVAVLFDLLGVVWRQRWLVRGADLLWALAAVATGAAFWAGKQAADSLVGVAPRAQSHIASHSDWALYALWAVGVVAAVRLAIAIRDRNGEQVGMRGGRWVLIASGVAAFGLLLWTADLGGALVYQHGVAVRTVVEPAEDASPPAGGESSSGAEPGEASVEPEPAVSRLVESADGTVVWSPLATDVEAIGSILIAAPGSSAEAVRAAAPPEGGEGLGLVVDGRSMLLLPGTFGDVQIDAVVDLSAFAGTFGLVHHARSADTAGLFSVSTSGSASLIMLEDGSRKTLDEQTAGWPDGQVELAVSSSGRHLKGLVDGKTVTHGHVAPGEAGGCGLLLDGSGSVGIITLRLTPLT
jgi:uncharacterized membrane protein